MTWRSLLKGVFGNQVVWIFLVVFLGGLVSGIGWTANKYKAQLAIKDSTYNTLVASYQEQHAKDLQAALTKGEMLQQKADQAAIEIAKSNQVLIAQNQKLQKDINYVLQADKPKQDATANGCNEFNGIGPLSLQLYNSALGY